MKVVNVVYGNLESYFFIGYIPARTTRKGKVVLKNYITNEKVVSQQKLKYDQVVSYYDGWMYDQV
jgi:hypothetical protein